MKQTMKHLSMGLALSLAGFANQGLAQSTPQQVAGSGWQALTNAAPSVAVNGTTEYVAWKSETSQKIMISALNGGAWTTPAVVGGTNAGSTWTAETVSSPALAVDDTTGYLWLAWTNPSSEDIYVSTLVNGAWTYREAVGGSGWKAETWKYGAPALSGGHGISLAWVGHSSQDIWYAYWNYPGWSTQQTVSGSGWTAQSEGAPPGWTQAELVQGLGSISTLFWNDPSGDVLMSNDFPFGWTEAAGVACDGWTATVFGNSTPAAAYFILNGNFYAAVFWIESSNGLLEYSYTTGSGCGFADPATVGGSGSPFLAPAVAIGPTVSILEWTKPNGPHTINSTIWYLDPTTLSGLN